MRALVFPLLLLLAGCLSNTSDLEVEPSFDKAIALNGFWDGQLDQSTDVRFLFYDGSVFGTGGDHGYLGTITYDETSEEVTMNLNVYGLTTKEAEAEYYVSGGDSEYLVFDGLLINQTNSSGTVVGNFTTASTGGSLTLNSDGSWANGSGFGQLIGTWTAGSYRIAITQVGDIGKFIGQGPAGCSFEGEIYLLNTRYPLFKMNMYSRQSCSGFNLNGETAEGYTAVNRSGALEVYMTLDNEQLIMTLTK